MKDLDLEAQKHMDITSPDQNPQLFGRVILKKSYFLQLPCWKI